MPIPLGLHLFHFENKSKVIDKNNQGKKFILYLESQHSNKDEI